MKAGPYCSYSLDEIIKIKQNEEKLVGKFFWGYSGVFCHPEMVNAFVKSAKSEKVIGLFSETKSVYETKEQGRFSEFSQDKVSWQKLPEKVLLVGNTKRPHFAICGKNLKKIGFEFNLSDYQVFLKNSLFPDSDKRLDEYFQYRVDKACGIYSPEKTKNNQLLIINYCFELTEPYCVYIR